MPPIKAAEPPSRCPATAMSTIPTKGIVMLARMLGRASLSISLSSVFTLLPFLEVPAYDG